MERVEIYVDISVALLAVESKWHFKSSAYPSSLPLHSQIAEDIDLSMVLNRHQLGIRSVLLRSVPLQSKPIAGMAAHVEIHAGNLQGQSKSPDEDEVVNTLTEHLVVESQTMS